MNQAENILINDSDARSRVSAEYLADTLCHHLTLDQQVLLRLFGKSSTGEFSDAEFVSLLRSFSLELPRRKRVVVTAIADDVEAGKSFVDAISSFNERKFLKSAKFQMIEQALQTAKEQDVLPGFLKAVYEYRPSRLSFALRYQDTMRKKLARLAIKTFCILQVTVFILLFILPEFQAMFTEYGIELPWVMQMFMRFSNHVAQYYVLFMLLAVLGFLYFVFNIRTLSSHVVAKFSPWSWIYRPLTKRLQRKVSFALSGGHTVLKQMDLNPSKKPTFSKSESVALEVAHSAEAKSWLLDRIVKKGHIHHAVWKNRFGDTFILFWNLLLACVVATIAFSIIACLTTIIRGLSG